MEMQELLTCSDVVIKASDAAPILGVDAQDLRNQAQTDASKLGFPVIVIGRRVLIPRVPFLQWLGEAI